MFQTDLVKEEYDDLSDLNSMQMESIREWEAQLAGMQISLFSSSSKVLLYFDCRSANVSCFFAY